MDKMHNNNKLMDKMDFNPKKICTFPTIYIYKEY